MFYQVKVKFDQMDEHGAMRKVTETHIVEGYTFTDVESGITSVLADAILGEFDVTTIARTKIAEVIADKFGIASKVSGQLGKLIGQNKISETPDKYFKVRVAFITLDENSGKERKTKTMYLVNASSVDAAHQLAEQSMRGTMSDFIIEAVDEMPIVDVWLIPKEEKK